jgi:hypothetical protein
MNEGSAHDTLRWGDTRALTTLTELNASEGHLTTLESGQLTNAHWRWPLVWQCQLIITPNLPAQVELETFEFALVIQIGVGQAVDTLVKNYTMAPAAITGQYSPVTDSFQLPAQDIQAQIIVSVLGGSQPTGPTNESIQCSFFVAPLTEPHAMTHMLNHMTKHDVDPGPEWMSEGFHEQPLRYRSSRG